MTERTPVSPASPSPLPRDRTACPSTRTAPSTSGPGADARRRRAAAQDAVAVARPLHARPHERPQVLRRAARDRRSHHRGVVAQVVESKHPDWAVGDLARTCPAGSSTPSASPAAIACSASIPTTRRSPPPWASPACPDRRLLRSAARRQTAGRRDGRRVRGLRRRRRDGRQIAKIHGCRVVGVPGRGQVRVLRRRTRLRRLRRLQGRRPSTASSPPPARTASTSTSRTSAARSSKRSRKLLNPGSRVPVCGYISAYNTPTGETIEPPDAWLKRTLDDPPETRFFVVTEWIEEFDEATAQLGAWIREGKLKYRETIVEGIEQSPSASGCCSPVRTSAS